MTLRNALRRGGGVPHKMYGTFPFSRKTRSSRLKTFSLSSFNINSGRGPTLPRRHDESIAAAAEYVLLLRFCHLLPQRSNRTIKKTLFARPAVLPVVKSDVCVQTLLYVYVYCVFCLYASVVHSCPYKYEKTTSSRKQLQFTYRRVTYVFNSFAFIVPISLLPITILDRQ